MGEKERKGEVLHEADTQRDSQSDERLIAEDTPTLWQEDAKPKRCCAAGGNDLFKKEWEEE